VDRDENGMETYTYSDINFFCLFSLITKKWDIESAMQICILVCSIELVKIHKRQTSNLSYSRFYRAVVNTKTIELYRIKMQQLYILFIM
jgi:hypothetical protein